jgi:hypothetical protein
MANIDYAGLLTGISGQNQQIDPFSLPTAAQQRMAFGAQQVQGMQRAGEGLFGMPSQQNPVDMAKTELLKLDRNDPEYQQKFIKLLGIADPEKAAELVKEKKVQDFSAGQQKALVKYLEANYPSFADAAKGDTPLITAANWKDFKEKAGSTKNQFGGTKLVKDENENLYYVTQSLDPTEDGNAAKTVYSPVTPNAPSQPSGAVTVVGDSGETPAERKAREISTSTGKIVGKGFAQIQADAAETFSETQEAIYTADRLIDIQNQIDTGGFQPVFAKAITDFLGTTAGDVGEFEYLVKNKMIQKLRAFGANPTEGERKAADELVESLKKSKKVNLAQLQSYKKEMERKAARQEFLLQDDITKKDYKDFVDAQYANAEPTENVVIWGARD